MLADAGSGWANIPVIMCAKSINAAKMVSKLLKRGDNLVLKFGMPHTTL